MEHTFRPSSIEPSSWGYSSDPDRLALPSILLVEDDRDIRDLLSTMFEMTGFAVVACETAEAGLNVLREQRFDLVLTDYALPRRSGTWLLQNAESEGLLQGTPALIVTAHPNVDSEDAYEVIQKPFDLDELVERVRHRLQVEGGSRRGRALMTTPKDGDHGDHGGDGTGCPEPIELILYVSANSLKADAAVSKMRRVLERFNSRKVTLTVCPISGPANVTAEPSGAVPAPYQHNAAARTLILGHITNPEILLELLTDCGIDP